MSDGVQTALGSTVRRVEHGEAPPLARRIARNLAGPLLICVAVLVTLNAFAFRGLLSNQHPDVLPFWLPTWCFLGKSLAAGHIPAWNPAVMGGIPFASDPQSGWMYVTPMLLFSTLPCGSAIRAFIVLQPILGGLGMYGFLRSEGTSRPGATVGGLALSLLVAGSLYLLSLPFAGMFAWTPLLLAAASRFVRSTSWAGRLIWLAVSALAWGQLASAHLSDGLVLGTGALVAFLVARLAADVWAKRRSVGAALALIGLVVLAFPLVNLAALLPRLAYLPRTTLWQGYARLDVISARFGAYAVDPVLTAGLASSFPLKLIRAPGFYMGTLGLGLSFAGFWNRRNRELALAFGVYGTVCYALSLQLVAHVLDGALGSSSLGGFYVHFPSRLVLGVFLSVSVLAALGVDAWRQDASPRHRVLMLLPAVVVWGMLAPLLGAMSGGFVVPAVAVGVGAIVLVTVAGRPRLAALVPLALAAELVASCLLVQRPLFRAASYLQPGQIASSLIARDDGRYLSLAPSRWTLPGYHVLQRRIDWGLMATQRSMLFHLEEAAGYNPTQLLRYWTFVRAADPKPMRYNAAGFVRARPVALDLLQVGYVVQPATDPPAVAGQTPVAVEGHWVLSRLPDPPPRASFVSSWSVVPSSSLALEAVLSPAFDPHRQTILERDPHLGIAPGPSADGTASFQWESPQSARVVVDTPVPGVVLVRNAYDPDWRATVDGRSAPVLAADYLVQGVPVPAGHHVVELRYEDHAIGHGLIGSGVALGLLIGAASIAAGTERRRMRIAPERREVGTTER